MKTPSAQTVVLAAYAVGGIVAAYLIYRAVSKAGEGFKAIADVPKYAGYALDLAFTAPVTAAPGNAVRFPGGRVVEVAALLREDSKFRISFVGDGATMTYHGAKYTLSPRGADGVYSATYTGPLALPT